MSLFIKLLRSRKTKLVLAIGLIMTIILSGAIGLLADSTGAQTINDIIRQQEQVTQQLEHNQALTQTTAPITPITIDRNPPQTSGDFFEALRGAYDFSAAQPEVAIVMEPVVRVIAVLTQALTWLILALLSLSIAIDMLYIGVSFTRSFLGGQRHLQGTNVGNQGVMGNMGVGDQFNSGGFGGGRFGRRFGGGGFGGGPMQGNNMGGQGTTSGFQGIQWVSNRALNLIAMESQISQDGRVFSPFTTYLKLTVVKIVLVPVILIVAISGVAVDLGIFIGQAIVGGIGGAL